MPNSPHAEPPMRPTQAQIDEVCDRHERFRTARPGGARAVFAWMDLSERVLSGRDLSEADLTGAILRGTKFLKTSLENSTLFGADLTDADLRGAKLRRADLRGASLRGANLTEADLFEADLREGSIVISDRVRGVVAHDAWVDRRGAPIVDLSGANLSRSQLGELSPSALIFRMRS